MAIFKSKNGKEYKFYRTFEIIKGKVILDGFFQEELDDLQIILDDNGID